MKKIILPFILIFSILSAVSCSGDTVTYKNDVEVSVLSEKTAAVLGNIADMTAVPESYITNIMKIDVSAFDGYAVYKQVNGATIDEYGIFKTASADGVSTAVKAIEDYISVTQASSMVTDYMPEEAPKLEGAEVKAMGEYIVYCILSEDSKAAVFSAVTSALTEK